MLCHPGWSQAAEQLSTDEQVYSGLMLFHFHLKYLYILFANFQSKPLGMEMLRGSKLDYYRVAVFSETIPVRKLQRVVFSAHHREIL